MVRLREEVFSRIWASPSGIYWEYLVAKCVLRGWPKHRVEACIDRLIKDGEIKYDIHLRRGWLTV